MYILPSTIHQPNGTLLNNIQCVMYSTVHGKLNGIFFARGVVLVNRLFFRFYLVRWKIAHLTFIYVNLTGKL